MNYRKKLFTLLGDLDGSPLAQDTAITHVASIIGATSRLIKGEIKATKRSAAQVNDGPDIEAATDDLFFDGASYWRREVDRNYGKLGREDVMLELRRRGFSPKKTPGSEISRVEEAVHHVQTNARVVYAAPLCGRGAGRHKENGAAILATDSPRIIDAVAGNAEPLETFFANLFGKAAGDPSAAVQFSTFLAWLQRARRALRAVEQHLPGQMLALVGAADCGKTLAQTLITKLLGGRQADPSLWLTGKSPFNDGIWGAEHWAASDSNIEDNLAARKMLRDRIKEATANESLGCHRKHRGEITLRPIARLTLSANDDTDSTFVLPVLDDSIKDKLIYLKCFKPPVPFPTDTDIGAKAFFNSLTDAIPAFLHKVETFDVPAELRKGRFGVREFHHPDIVNLLVGANADSDLSDILTDWLEHGGGNGEGQDYVGTAALLDGLLNGSVHGETYRRVCSTATKLGQALGRLSRADGWRGRVIGLPVRVGGNHQKQMQWTIRRTVGTGVDGSIS
jgi:hypothetical protein